MKDTYPIPVKVKTALKVIQVAFLSAAFVCISSSCFSRELLPATNPVPATVLSMEADFFPFELISFHAKYKGNEKVMLNWVTAKEINTSHFVMQRSIDGIRFDDAAVLFTAEGNRNTKMEYNYADNITDKSGLVYYRLKMVDMNGAYIFSEAIQVHIEKTNDLIARN